MKRILLFLLVILPACLAIGFYFLDKSFFLCPIEYRRDIIIRSDSRGDGFFGAERNGKRLHEGVDLLAEVGTAVLASRSGKVIAARQNRGMGKYVIIRHAQDIVTVYGHLSEVCVKQNEFIRQGQVIGRVGKTGNANYPDIQAHLHFEVKQGGIPQDPLRYLE